MNRTTAIDRYVTDIPSFPASSKRELQTLSEPSMTVSSLRARVLLGSSHLTDANTQEATPITVGEERLPLTHQIGNDELITRLAAAAGTGHVTAGRLQGTLDEGVELDRTTGGPLGLARVLRQCRLAYVNPDPRQAQPLFEEAYRLAAESDYRVVASWALDGLASCLSSSIANPPALPQTLGGDDHAN